MQQPTILIVDDNPENLMMLGEMLSGLYRLRAASSGARALQLAQQEPLPDLIPLDVLMPQMSGYEVLERLRAEPHTRDIPVIFITAMNSEDDEQRGLVMGAVDYIAKPLRQAIVLDRAHTHLDLKQARVRLQRYVETLAREVRQHPQHRHRPHQAVAAAERRVVGKRALYPNRGRQPAQPGVLLDDRPALPLCQPTLPRVVRPFGKCDAAHRPDGPAGRAAQLVYRQVEYIPDRHEGVVRGFLMVSTEVSDTKQAELQLQQANAELVLARDLADAANQAATVSAASPAATAAGLTLPNRQPTPGLSDWRVDQDEVATGPRAAEAKPAVHR